MNTTYAKNLSIRSLVILILAHIPIALLYLGVEIIPIVVWSMLLENIPLLFLDVHTMDWFETGEFGIMSYSWQGFIISFFLKYITFVFLISLFDFFFRKRVK
jgi:hypothetical protein